MLLLLVGAGSFCRHLDAAIAAKLLTTRPCSSSSSCHVPCACLPCSLDIPELHAQQRLPSDTYNQVAAQPLPQAQAPRVNYGLLGSSSAGGGSRAPAAEPLAPYAGVQQRGLIPGTPSRDQGEEQALQLSQEAAIQLSQEAAQQPLAQAHIPFAQSRIDTARIARRKAATAAIAARAYKPPTAPPQAPAARGLFGSAGPGAPQQQQAASSGLARQISGGQQSLLNFGFTVQQQQAQQPPAVSTGPDDMDMS